jgi:hypothetical protein
MTWKSKLAAGVVAISFGLASASAAPISGELNIAGSVLVDAFTINWVPPGGPGGGTETGYGIFSTIVPGTGYFSGITSLPPCPPNTTCYFGNARDLTRGGGGGAAPAPATAPVGVTGNPLVANFLSGFTAPGYTGLSFDLTLILQSVAADCVPNTGQLTCRPDSGSPFTLTRLANGTGISFEVNGNFKDSNIADSTAAYVGRYTTQVPQTIEQILAIVGANGSVSASYSANFNAVSPIPEPGTVGLALTGVLMIGVGLLRRKS